MPFGPPFRSPCNGWQRWLSPLFAHFDASRESLPLYTNTTTPLPQTQPSSDPCAQPCGGAGQPPCGAFSRPFPTQTFAFSQNVNLSRCKKNGRKAVAARARLLGSPGFQSHEFGFNDVACPPSNTTDPTSPDYYLPGKVFENYQPNPSATRYLSSSGTLIYSNDIAQGDSTATADGSFSGKSHCSPSSGIFPFQSGSWGGSMSLSVAIDALSGIGSVTGQTASDFVESNPNFPVASTIGCRSSSPPARLLAALTALMAGGPRLASNILNHDMAGDGCLNIFDQFGQWNDLDQVSPDGLSHDQIVTERSISIGDDSLVIDLTRVERHWQYGNTNGSYYCGSYGPFNTDGSETWFIDFGTKQTVHLHIEVYLGSPMTMADVQAKLVELLALWPLNDDTLLDWRTDPSIGLVPLVELNQKNNSLGGAIALQTLNWINSNPAVPTSWYFQPSAPNTDPGVGIYDGSIIGAPSAHLADKIFDYGQLVWSHDCFDSLGNQYWAVVGYGQWCPAELFLRDNAGTPIGTRVTHWTNAYEEMAVPAGAFYGRTFFPSAQSSGDFVWDDRVWAIKYAEIGDVWTSQDFSRPWGWDKFSLDQQFAGPTNSVWCFSSIAGNVVSLRRYDGNGALPVPFTPGDIVGGPCVGGFFVCAAVGAPGADGPTVTLGQKVYDVPGGWPGPFLDGSDAGGAFGKLKFPGAPGMIFSGADGGRVRVTVTNGTTVTPAVSQPCLSLGAAGPETVRFFDANMAPVAVTTLARVNDDQFTAGADVSGAVWMTPENFYDGSPWNYSRTDSEPKGDFVHLEWIWDTRTAGEALRLSGVTDCNGAPLGNVPYVDADGQLRNPDGTANFAFKNFVQTQECLGYTPCAPRVAGFSPNGETFSDGVIFPFNFQTVDFRYNGNNNWQGRIVWTMGDLISDAIGAPHQPCGHTDPWTAANGDCSDMTNHYRNLPIVECRMDVPAGFPSLPAGVSIGFASPVTSATGVGPPEIPASTNGTRKTIYESSVHVTLCSASCGYPWMRGC